MRVRCPQCRETIRMSDIDSGDRVIRYLCQACERIVAIDLALDEIRHPAVERAFDSVRGDSTVLVADDAWSSGEVIAGILREADHVVRVVHDGDTAWQQIQLTHPDVVVLDLMLPGLSGFDIVRKVAGDQRLRRTSVLVVGSVCKPEIVHYLHELGAAGFIDRDRLVETLLFRVQILLDDRGRSRRAVRPDRPSAWSSA